MSKKQNMLRVLMLSAAMALFACGAPAETTVYGSGVLQPVSQPVVFAEVDATIGEILVGLGDSVQEGDVLVKLVNGDLQLEVEELDYALAIAQESVQDVRTRELWRYEMRVDKDTGAPIVHGGTGEIIYEKYSNELNIRAPMDGRVKAIYVDVGSDALAVYRDKGCIMVISTDGCMKVSLDDVSVPLELSQRVRVTGEGIDCEGLVQQLTRRGMQAEIRIVGDKYAMDTPVTVTTLDGEVIGESILEVNKPLGVTAYGGIIRALSTYVGQVVKRDDVLAMFTWESQPLYVANAASLREYDKAKIERDTAKEKLNKLAIAAPCSGRIATIDAEVGDTVEDGTQLLSILAEEGMEAVLSVDELDIVHVKPGQKVVMELHALEDVTLTGVVKKIAPLGNTETSVTRYDVYVTLDAQDARVLGGMNVSGEIYIE